MDHFFYSIKEVVLSFAPTIRAFKSRLWRESSRRCTPALGQAGRLSYPGDKNQFVGQASRLSASLRGFTLLEILIAIAIMSIILVALYSTYLLTHKALFDVDKSLVKLQEARAFADIMKREIESTLYSQDNTSSIFKMDDRDFYGKQASSLTMTTSSPLMKGLAKINYTVEERDGILIITKGMVSAIAQASEETRVDLLEDIESFTLQAKYQDGWVKTWDSSLAKKTPEEVKITLTMRMTERERETRSATLFSISETAKLRIGSTL